MSEIKTIKPRVSDADFVRCFLSSVSNDECATRCGLTPASVSARAAKLRNKGVKLPRYDRAVRQTEVDSLNALISGIVIASAVE